MENHSHIHYLCHVHVMTTSAFYVANYFCIHTLPLYCSTWSSWSSLLVHINRTHFSSPSMLPSPCRWDGCHSNARRQKLSLLTHLQVCWSSVCPHRAIVNLLQPPSTQCGVGPVCVPIELLSTYFNLPQPSVVLVQCVSP